MRAETTHVQVRPSGREFVVERNDTLLEAALRAGTLVALAFQLPARPFLVLHHRDRYQSKAAQAFLKIITKFAEPPPARPA